MKAHTMPNDNIKRLYRSRTDKSWLGVCGGLAQYMETDTTPIRVAWLVITILTGIVPGLVAYLLVAMVMPYEPEEG